MPFKDILNLTAGLRRWVWVRTDTGLAYRNYSIKVKTPIIPVRVVKNNPKGKMRKLGKLITYNKEPYTVYTTLDEYIRTGDVLQITDLKLNLEVVKAKRDGSLHHYELQCKISDN